MKFKSINDFLVHVQAELNSNRLILPSLPDIVFKVQAAVNKESSTTQDLADIISTDPALSARLIQVANSPIYRRQVAIKDVKLAISLLGNKTVSTLVSILLMRNMYTPSSPLLKEHFHKVWEDSVNISAISRALASFTPHLSPDEAMLAGLIHQIGKLPILMLVEQLPEFKDHPIRLAKLLEKAHTPIGKLIMNTWDFPESLKLPAYEYLNFNKVSDEPASYVDIVQVAYLQSISGSNNKACQLDWSKIQSFQKIGLAPEIEVVEMEGIPERIHAAKQQLAM